MAAATLVEEAAREDATTTAATSGEQSLPDIFSFYAFLRRNPLVMRQRLTSAGIQLASTEQFLAYARDLESRVTPNERRLYFRTASAHLTSGCPLLALDVLSILPHNFCNTVGGVIDVKSTMHALESGTGGEQPTNGEPVDWSEPTNVVKDDELKLNWSDQEEDASDGEKEEDEAAVVTTKSTPNAPRSSGVDVVGEGAIVPAEKSESIDFISRTSTLVCSSIEAGVALQST